MSMYGLRRGPGSKRRSAHLTSGPHELAFCGRPINMTANIPFGRPTCKDCVRLSAKEKV